MNIKRFKQGDIIVNDKTGEILIFRNDYAIPSPNLCGIDSEGKGVLRNTLQDYRLGTQEEADIFMNTLHKNGWEYCNPGLKKIPSKKT